MATTSKPWIALIYFYLISAICVITIIFAGINGLMGLYTIVDPESNLDKYEWQTYADIDQFKQSRLSGDTNKRVLSSQASQDTILITKPISDEEWEKRWQRYRQVTLQGQVMSGKRNLINTVVILIVCLPIFLLHWRWARKASGSGIGGADISVDKP